MSGLRVYSLGRGRAADVVLPACDASGTLSRVHAEFCCLDDSRFRVRDLGSLNGVFVRRGDDWLRSDAFVVGLDDSIRLGDYVIAVADLLALLPPVRERVLRRNPHTGAVEEVEL